MKEISKEDIEQLKRDLYTYGYYEKKIKYLQLKLQEVNMQLKDKESVRGIRYDSQCISKDPYYSSVVDLIYQEEGIRIERDTFIEKKKRLGFERLSEVLTKMEYEIIEAHFFNGLSYSVISVNKGFLYPEHSKKISYRTLNKILNLRQ